MSKTMDDLLSDFDAAVMRAQSLNREDLPAWAHRRAGVVAVARALRDEIVGYQWAENKLNEILGDAGAEWLDDALKDDDGRIYVPQFLRAQLEQPK